MSVSSQENIESVPLCRARQLASDDSSRRACVGGMRGAGWLDLRGRNLTADDSRITTPPLYFNQLLIIRHDLQAC